MRETADVGWVLRLVDFKRCGSSGEDGDALCCVQGGCLVGIAGY